MSVESKAAGKARGAFYTPPELARFLARWAVRAATDRILEPSCGEGAFISPIRDRFDDVGVPSLRGRLTCVEREPAEAEKVRQQAPDAEVLTADFFDIDRASTGAIDAVIGNPPYIRYHGFTGEDRAKAQLRTEAQGIRLTGLASSWAHFVVHAVSFLRPGGRLALVLPAELLHADYGDPVRTMLLDRFSSIVVVAFDRAMFEDAQVDAVLLLASDDDDRGLRVIRVPDEKVLSSIEIAASLDPVSVHATGRWDRAIDPEAAAIYEAAVTGGRASPLGIVASVDIGFVSGANDFFIMTRDQAVDRGLPADALTPAVRRPGDVPGLSASGGDVRLLLDLSKYTGPFDDRLMAYLSEGSQSGILDRYKCRTRQPWYAVPLPRVKPQLFMPYMNHLGPRLIVNDADAWSSNLLHGVSLGVLAPPARALAVAATSSLSLLSAEIEGRAYGGGVLKLETKEAERLLIPVLDSRQVIEELEAVFTLTSEAIRTGEVEPAAVTVDRILGLDHDVLWKAYEAFCHRRLGRRRAVNRAIA